MTTPPSGSEQEELRWVKRLQGRYPEQTRDLDPVELLMRVRESLVLCPSLEITEEKDIFRFLALSVLLTPEQKKSKLVEGVTRRILSNLDWDGTRRLDFLYKRLVGRPVSPNEMDFGPNFIPVPHTPM
jgi:hypothetical protein